MDQVKKIGGIMWQQRFWILCVSVTLIPVGGWFTTTSHLRKVTNERKTAIKSKVDAAKALLAKQDHPNEISHQGLDALRNAVTNKVAAAWTSQYEKQKGLLVWPKELLPDFLAAVEPLRPVEKVNPPTSPTDEVLKVSLRERYRNYIGAELPKLSQKIDSIWHSQEGAAAGDEGMFPGGGGYADSGQPGTTGLPGTVIPKETVSWSASDQMALRSRYDWSHTLEKVPRTIDVLYAQEDLWIMSALMDIIATTNQGATGRYNAIVKEIAYINLGRDVGGRSGSIMRIGSATGGGYGEDGTLGGGMMPGGMMPGGMAPTGMMPPGMGEGGMDLSGSRGAEPESGGGLAPGMSGMMGGMAGAAADPAEYRYVDPDLTPVSATTLRTAITSETQDPAQAMLVVAKRIPVKLGLTIDQRKLNILIAACANASLTLEVRQVRFNRQGGSTASSGGMGGGMPGMGMPGGGGLDGGMGMPGMGMPGMGMPGMGGYGGRGEGGLDGGGMPGAMPGGFGGMGEGGGSGYDPSMGLPDVNLHEKPIEIIGVVYIYNPVDVKKLAIEKKEAGPAVPGADPPAEGAAAVPDQVAVPPAAAPPS